MKSEKPKLPPQAKLVFDTISRRTKLNPIKSLQLESLFEISDRQVRNIVHHYRFIEFYPVASGSKGYYMARTLTEWETTENNLKSRVFSMLTDLDKIKRKNFSGQQGLFET